MNVTKIMQYLDEYHPFFKTLILNIGRPVMDPRIPTAEVRQRKGEKDFEFACNPNFFDKLTLPQQAGVFAHEATHILLTHLKELEDPQYDNRQKLVVAHECITNDFVTNEGFDLPDSLIFGPDRVGHDTASYTTREVYDELPDDQTDTSDEDEGHFSLTSDQADELMKQIGDAIAKNYEPRSKQMQDLLDQATGKKAGMTGDAASAWARKNKAKLEWVKLLRKLDPDFLEGSMLHGGRKPSWHAPRRKTAHLAPEISLPNFKSTRKGLGGRQKPKLVLALDQSGSIPPQLAETMRELARSIPGSIEVECCTFSTFYKPFDYKKDRNDIAQGGTDFSAIEEFVRDKSNGKYPRSIVVITDGEANFGYLRPSTEQLMNNWYWVMTPRSYQPYCPGFNPDHVFKLDNFVDKSLCY